MANRIQEAKSVKSLKVAYDKAVKKEQALSSLMLVNLEKYKTAKSKGDEKAIAKFTKIAGQLSKKKKAASDTAQTVYDEMDNAISGLHRDAELQIDEVRKLIRKAIIKEAGVFDTAEDAPEENEGGAEDPKSNMAVKKFDMILKGKPGWEKTKEIAAKLSDVKQADFIEYLMNDLASSDMARKKLKLRL